MNIVSTRDCGRGVTSCLICSKEKRQYMINNIVYVYYTKLIFESDEFNILLKESKICLKCVGRLHQLFDFDLIQRNQDAVLKEKSKPLSCDSLAGDSCFFCNEEGRVIKETENHIVVQEAVFQTKWAQDFKPNDVACYSCYNFLLYHIKLKKILAKQKEWFFLRVNRCRVVLSRNETTDALNKYPAIRCSSPTDSAMSIYSGGINGSLSPTTHKEEEAIESQKIRKRKQEFLVKDEEPKIRKLSGPKSILRKRLNIQDYNDNDVVGVDKFELIKMRRSSNRPIVLTPANAKKPFPVPIVTITVKKEKEAETVLHQKTLIDETTTADHEQEASFNVPSDEPGSDGHNNSTFTVESSHGPIASDVSQNSSPTVQQTGQKAASTSKRRLGVLLNEINVPTLQVPGDYQDMVEIQVSLTAQDEHGDGITTSASQESPPTAESQGSSSVDLSTQAHVDLSCFDDPIENFINNLPDESLSRQNRLIFPQLYDIPNEEVLPKTLEDFTKKYSLRPVQISLIRIAPNIIAKVVGDRMPLIAKTSKKGRVCKPKIIVDPSPVKQKYRKTLKPKFVLKKPNNKAHKTKEHKQVPLAPSAEPLVLTDADVFPNFEEYTEDFIDLSDVPDSSIEMMDMTDECEEVVVQDIRASRKDAQPQPDNIVPTLPLHEKLYRTVKLPCRSIATKGRVAESQNSSDVAHRKLEAVRRHVVPKSLRLDIKPDSRSPEPDRRSTNHTLRSLDRPKGPKFPMTHQNLPTRQHQAPVQEPLPKTVLLQRSTSKLHRQSPQRSSVESQHFKQTVEIDFLGRFRNKETVSMSYPVVVRAERNMI